MNKNILIAITFLVPASAFADWKSTALDVLQFSAGAVAGMAVHEAGHMVAARLYHEDLEWSGRGLGVQWYCELPCNRQSSIAMAGNISTAIVGESLLQLKASGSFVDGMQAFNSINPIAYAIADSITLGGYGDYRNVDNRIQAVLAVHGASIGYRHFSGRWALSLAPIRLQFSRSF